MRLSEDLLLIPCGNPSAVNKLNALLIIYCGARIYFTILRHLWVCLQSLPSSIKDQQKRKLVYDQPISGSVSARISLSGIESLPNSIHLSESSSFTQFSVLPKA
ncbi:unnamed protein product [Lactuca virosa]|uniref:Uncharacterized protein n=1 Tax=Lactuca virosa TaxID=75947 RepID=A0AAU9M6K5_9ASTR|nr:unnamed protein product [Lactuca virosa]